MNYDRAILYGVAAVMAPYLSGSAAAINYPGPVSLLEKAVELNGYAHANGRYNAHNNWVTVPFHRGTRPEVKKEPVPMQPRIHGHRTPRSDYGWCHAGQR